MRRSKRERIEARHDARDRRWWRRDEVLVRGMGRAGGSSPYPPYAHGKRPARRALKAARPHSVTYALSHRRTRLCPWWGIARGDLCSCRSKWCRGWQGYTEGLIEAIDMHKASDA